MYYFVEHRDRRQNASKSVPVGFNSPFRKALAINLFAFSGLRFSTSIVQPLPYLLRQFNVRIHCLINDCQNLFILYLRFVIFVSKLKNIINVDRNLFNQLYFKFNIVIDAFFIRNFMFAELIAEVQIKPW